MGLDISAIDLERYRASAQTRLRSQRGQREARRQRAWHLARLAADLLKTQYGAPLVSVFGSLIHPDRFTQWSDVDLAVWGLSATNWLKASAAVRALESLSGVENVQANGDTLLIMGVTSQVVMNHLLQNHIIPTEISAQKNDLESLFMDVTSD